MRYIKYLKIENFKIFGDEIIIDFGGTTVLVGPNNAGKTTIIQALTLWQLGIRAFFDAKTKIDPKTQKRILKGEKIKATAGIGINRRDIEQVPNTDVRQLFNKSRVRTGTVNEQIKITIGLFYKSTVQECEVSFKYFKSELVYAYLNETLCDDADLLIYASDLQINLLYPMSGLAREETLLQEGAIRKQIGTGITAGLLRNICYNLYINDQEVWKKLTELMEKLFYIKLEAPRYLANADLILEYNYADKSLKADKSLDILQAGRGQLQMLLIFAFVMGRKNSVVLIDEPDAHLEVLRQSQVMEVLKSLTSDYACQAIIATHSEVIMNEAKTMNFIHNGKRIELDETKQKAIKSSLKDFGIEQYYKAELTKSVLYLEGTTDKDNLTALAHHLNHPLEGVLTDRIFIYYTQSPDINHEEFEIKTGYYQTHEKHFAAIKGLVESLEGIAVFDNDNKNKENIDNKNGLKTRFWKQYELENYFITPESVMAFIKNHFIKKDGGNLFLENKLNDFKLFFENNYLLPIFDGLNVLLNLYKNSNRDEKAALYASNSQNKKVSKLLNDTFEKYAQETNEEIILRKGDFYKIIPFCNKKSIDNEVKQYFDEMYDTLKKSPNEKI